MTFVDQSSFQSPYGNSARDFGWGCLAEHCCCQAMVLLYADAMTGGDVPDESYLDAMPSYASNEIAINWNASLVAFVCWLDALGR